MLCSGPPDINSEPQKEPRCGRCPLGPPQLNEDARVAARFSGLSCVWGQWGHFPPATATRRSFVAGALIDPVMSKPLKFRDAWWIRFTDELQAMAVTPTRGSPLGALLFRTTFRRAARCWPPTHKRRRRGASSARPGAVARGRTDVYWQPASPGDVPPLQVRVAVPLTLHAPSQVMLQLPLTHSTFDPAPTVCVHDLPAHVTWQNWKQAPVQVAPLMQ